MLTVTISRGGKWIVIHNGADVRCWYSVSQAHELAARITQAATQAQYGPIEVVSS